MLAWILPSSFNNPYASLDPASATTKFTQNFERQYGNVHPSFAEESYVHAFQRSKKEFKFVVIYLHSSQHQDTDEFCSQLVATETVSGFLNDHFIVWANDIRSPEGYRLSQSLEASSFPFMAVVTNNYAGGMTMLDKWEGMINTEELMTRLTNILERHGQILTNARIEHETRDFDRRIREEQEEAYQESLLADQERERMVNEERMRQDLDRARREQEERETMDRQRDRERRKEDLARSIAPEPPSDDRRAVRIAIRLPDGSRLQRRFSPESRVEAIYDFVDSQRVLSEYDLVSSHPRQIYNDRTLTLSSVGLVGQSSLFVEEH